jgi:endonuclease/exonuclease/phosphatase (EEP) superfamily protein YafD
VGYSLLTVVAAICVWWLSDRWWLATTLLFGPRWVLALPLLLLVPTVARWDRLMLVPLGISALVVAGPVVGLRTGWRSWVTESDPVRDVRVVTFNAMGGKTLRLSPSALLLAWNPDILVVQECASELSATLRDLSGWFVRTNGTLCIVSRDSIDAVEVMDREAFEAAGGSGLVATYRVLQDRGTEYVTNLHLDTPRAGLTRIRHGDLEPGIERLESKSSLRAIELLRARHWVDGFPAPHIVAGDFNTPPESPIYRAAWRGWHNAFSLAGVGLGGTRLNGWIRARIDHVLADTTWQVVSARISDDVGSDHAAMIVELRPRRGR